MRTDVRPTAAAGGYRPAYTVEAGSYDRRTRPYQALRDRIVEQLPLSSGDVVLDVGCGTGLCLPRLARLVGPSGMVIGIDEAPDMLALARQRLAGHGWRTVTLIESSVEDAEIPVTADAALFCAVHDILRSRRAVDNVMRHVRPGGWVAAGGGKWSPPWLVGMNMMVRALHEPFVRSFEGFDEPYALLRPYVGDLKVTEVNGGYLACGQTIDATASEGTPPRRAA